MGTIVLAVAVVFVAVILLLRHFSSLEKDIGSQSLKSETKPETSESSWIAAERLISAPAPSVVAIDHKVDLSLVPKEFVVLDLETTGLSPEMHEIIEVGAIRVNRDSDTHLAFQSLVKPVQRIPRKITQITGITQAMVDNDGLPLSEVLVQFKEFVGDLPIVAFNAPFDMSFIWNAAKTHGVSINNRYACALKLVRRAYPDLPSHRLVDLAKWGNLSDEETHRALGDCKRTITVFTASASKLGERIPWEVPKVDWRVSVQYHKERDVNRSFVVETLAFEASDPELAATRYREAMARMYEYEKLIYSCRGDDHILDRLTLVLGKLGRHEELVSSVDRFMKRFPETHSSIMDGILKRREKAERKSSGRSRGRENHAHA